MNWTKSDIRRARRVELAPLLLARGYRLQELMGGNHRILSAPNGAGLAGLVIKANYWIWNDRQAQGNTIDFLVQVEGLSFHQAMQVIAASPDYDSLATESSLQTTERAWQ
jgi:hypothetical protein